MHVLECPPPTHTCTSSTSNGCTVESVVCYSLHHRRTIHGVGRERTHPMGLRQKQSNQPLFDNFLFNFYHSAPCSTRWNGILHTPTWIQSTVSIHWLVPIVTQWQSHTGLHDRPIENSTHELAKLSSLFSAFRKCLKLPNWYHNVLCCL